MVDAFISYARNDAPLVKRVRDSFDFESIRGVSSVSWYDDRTFIDEIMGLLDKAAYAIVLVSDNWLRTDSVRVANRMVRFGLRGCVLAESRWAERPTSLDPFKTLSVKAVAFELDPLLHQVHRSMELYVRWLRAYRQPAAPELSPNFFSDQALGWGDGTARKADGFVLHGSGSSGKAQFVKSAFAAYPHLDPASAALIYGQTPAELADLPSLVDLIAASTPTGWTPPESNILRPVEGQPDLGELLEQQRIELSRSHPEDDAGALLALRQASTGPRSGSKL